MAFALGRPLYFSPPLMCIVLDSWKIPSLLKIPVLAEFSFIVPKNSGSGGTAFCGFSASLMTMFTHL